MSGGICGVDVLNKLREDRQRQKPKDPHRYIPLEDGRRSAQKFIEDNSELLDALHDK